MLNMLLYFITVFNTPSAHLTVNAAIIDTPFRALDTAYTLGSRLQVDF
jgi:hypothetical protein